MVASLMIGERQKFTREDVQPLPKECDECKGTRLSMVYDKKYLDCQAREFVNSHNCFDCKKLKLQTISAKKNCINLDHDKKEFICLKCGVVYLDSCLDFSEILFTKIFKIPLLPPCSRCGNPKYYISHNMEIHEISNKQYHQKLKQTFQKVLRLRATCSKCKLPRYLYHGNKNWTIRKPKRGYREEDQEDYKTTRDSYRYRRDEYAKDEAVVRETYEILEKWPESS
ncbi:hypothetical protein ACFLQ6_08005 [Thermoproteota archaeon]